MTQISRQPAKPKTYTGHFFFDPADRIYRDHFPGNPVVPGSLVINGFFLAVREDAGYTGDLTVESFRFRAFLTPGTYDYSLIEHADCFTCSVMRQGKKLVTGGLRK